MNSDRLHEVDGSMAKSPKVCGGVVMERKKSMMSFGAKMIRSLIITGCCALMLVGSISEANAAAADMLHSSANVGTKYGTWGAAFDCTTCHVKNSDNIKRIKSTIETNTVVAGSATGYGDDSDARGATESNRVCEVCHTQTDYHRITTTSTPDLTHNNNSDCVSCHQHNQAFKANCDDCHGGEATDTTPIATNVHSKHILTSAGNYGFSCDTCHPVDHDGSVEVTFTGIGAGGTYSGAGTKQCSNLYCHGSANTADWDAGTGGNCGDCHGAIGTGRPDAASEPTGGSHTTTSHAAAACTACHTHDGSNTTEHVNGPANSFGDALVSTAGTGITAYTAPTATLGSSPDPDGFKYGNSNCTASCHGNGTWGQAGGCNFCHGYPPDGSGGSTNHFARTGGSGVTDAQFYSLHNVCSTCHGVSGNQTPPTAATARAGVVDLSATGGDAYLDPSMHNDGKVQMNGYDIAIGDGTDDKNAGYDGAGGCAKACHPQTVKLNGTIQANTLELREFGSGTCDGCHDVATAASASAPAVVDISGGTHNGVAYGTHLQAAIESLAGVTDWTVQCTKCHNGHADGTVGVNDVEISTISDRGAGNTLIPTLTEQYASHDSYIQLGGTATAGYSVSTEAELCWSCHDAQATKISEWDTNTQTNGLAGARNYDFGQVYTDSGMGTSTSKWIGTYWNSANYDYKQGYLNNKPTTADSVNGTANAGSTHAANIDSGASGVDTATNIRCTYCHDVHNGNAGAAVAGAPYLRGNWKGNPYYEDGAPRLGVVFTDANRYDLVPRGSASATRDIGKGGYWIDQNSDYPTNNGSTPGGGPVWTWTDGSRWTLDSSAGLCTTCHGSNVDTMNEFGTASTDWVGSNGHANAAIGGTGSGRTNIYSEGDATYGRKPNDGFCAITSSQGACADYPNMGYLQYSPSDVSGSSRGFGMRGNAGEGESWMINPRMVINRPYAWQDFAWGVSVDDNTTETQYHRFSCSKCHSPHASRLPRLMITNCLDTKNNTWDDAPPGAVLNETITLSSCNSNPELETSFTVNFWEGKKSIDFDNGYELTTTGLLGSDYADTCDVTFSSDPGTTYAGIDVSYGDQASNSNGQDKLEFDNDDAFDLVPGFRATTAGGSDPGENTVWSSVDNAGSYTSNLSSAQNCHRVADPVGSPNAHGPGWNNVTPW